jgi:uncharacterized integral membrane protein
VVKGRKRSGSLGFVIGVVVAIPATLFALSNLEPATVEFLGWQAKVPLWAVIGLSVLAGVLIGSALTAAFGARRRREKKRRAQARSTDAATTDGTAALEADDSHPALEPGDAAQVDGLSESSLPTGRELPTSGDEPRRA